MIVAHLSDLHVLGDGPIAPWRLLNKRATGYANIRLRRGAIHRRSAAAALARELRRRQVDHVVITGDVSNLALEDEFASVRRLLSEDLGYGPERLSMVPGNHDLYTRGAARTKRFAHYFAPFMTSDLPGLAVDHPAGPFPYVRLRDGVALVGLASAVPSPPMCAFGRLGGEQLASLRRLLDLPEVRERFVVVMLHHPPFNPRSPISALRKGLHDAAELRACLGHGRSALVLHGHLHERVVQEERWGQGGLISCGATSASLVDDDPDARAGFNLYEVDGGGLRSARTVVLGPGGDGVVERALMAAS